MDIVEVEFYYHFLQHNTEHYSTFWPKLGINYIYEGQIQATKSRNVRTTTKTPHKGTQIYYYYYIWRGWKVYKCIKEQP